MTTNTQATPREAREWLLSQSELPEGVTVGVRGRLSKQAKDHFTANTGQVVASPVAADSAAE